MLFGKSKAVEHYFGRESYRYIDGLIGGKGDVLLVSPYVDIHYADMMLGRKAPGDVYLISSSPQPGAQRRLTKGRGILPIAAYLMLSIAILAFLLLIRAGYAYLLIALIPLAIGAARLGPRNGRVHLKSPRSFVHAKMYISDGVAVTGSANLTYSGTHRNVEHISMTHDPADIAELKDQFWKMWKEA